MKTNMSVVEREILLTVIEELLPKSNTELLIVEKRLNLIVSDSFTFFYTYLHYELSVVALFCKQMLVLPSFQPQNRTEISRIFEQNG